MKYEQMTLDCRLDSEIELDDNIGKVAQFAYGQLRQSLPEGSAIKNRHEGYGVLAEEFQSLQLFVKSVSEGMKEYLKILPTDDNSACSTANKIEAYLMHTITAAVRMAAQCRRVADDLYDNLSDYKTPLEEYAESMEDGFEEAEEGDDGP